MRLRWNSGIFVFVFCLGEAGLLGAGRRFPSLTPPGHVRIVSWNIEFLGRREPRRTDEQLRALAERIRSFDAAVLALQETDSATTLELVGRLLGPSWRKCCGRPHNSILYDAARIEPLSFDSLGRNYPGRRLPGMALFRPYGTDGKRFRVVSVHFSSSNSFTKEAEALWVREGVADFLATPHESEVVFVMGDMNAPPATEPHAILQEDGLLTLVSKENVQFTRPFGTNELDHVYASQGALESLPNESVFVVLPAHYSETDIEFEATYSDHLPIFVDFFFLEGEPPKPVLTASVEEGVSPLTVEWTGEASTADEGQSLVSFAWNFGDGGTAESSATTHIYRRSGIYDTVLTVTDDRGAGAEASKRIIVEPAAGSLAPWESVDVGAETSGASGFEDGCLSLIARDRAGATGNEDRFHFLYQRLTGDTVLTVRLSDFVAAAESSSFAGLLLRETLDSGAPRLAALVVEHRAVLVPNIRFQNRRSPGAAIRRVARPAVTRPDVWLRLERKGDEVIGSQSIDGESWRVVGSVTLEIPETVFVGIVGAGTAARFCKLAVETAEAVFLPGDCNGDGSLSLIDTLAILGRLFRHETSSCEVACDTDGDTVTAVTDALLVLQLLFGETEPFVPRCATASIAAAGTCNAPTCP